MFQRVVFGVVTSVVLASCRSATIDEPVPYNPNTLTFALVSPKTLRAGDAFSTLQDTVVVEVRDVAGKLAPAGYFVSVNVTGWMRTLDSGRWFRYALLRTDSSGHVRVIWQFSGSPAQRLAIGSIVVSLPLPRPAALLAADTVVTSGPAVVCIQQDGRVGCVDDGPADSAAAGRGPGRLSWLSFDAPIINITSNINGACALLTDGRTACWEGRGPLSPVPSDTGHPPLVELRGAVGRTATGVIWFRYRRTGYPAGWLRVPSDSVITALLENSNDNAACGRTADNTVMCGLAIQSSLSPGFRSDSMRLVRDSATGVSVRANGGYSAQEFLGGNSLDRLALSRLSGGTLGLTRFSDNVAQSKWVPIDPPDATLSGPDARIRVCVTELDPVCDASRPWRSVSRAGMLLRSHISYESGYQRTCGIRSIVVCSSRDATSRLDYSSTYQVLARTIVDTIRLAP